MHNTVYIDDCAQ